jgi:dihydroorotase
MLNELILPMPFDAHVHVRRGEMLKRVLKYTARQFGTGLLMPNTDPGIFLGKDVTEYHKEVLSNLRGERFHPLISIKLRNETTTRDIDDAHQAGAIAAKLYPRGVTNNSDDGVDLEHIHELFPVFEKLRRHKMLLLLHGEHPKSYFEDAEDDFLEILEEIHAKFPRLHIVLEHISTAEAVHAIRQMGPTVAATITIHHMLLTGNDVVKGKLRPHNYCLPMAKRPLDRRTVLHAALSGSPKFFLGTDSAPHLIAKKECDEGCGGIFTAPCALEYLATIFESQGALQMLPDFVGKFGYEHYEIPRPVSTVKLVREEWIPEDEYDGVKAFKHPDVLPLRWRFAGKQY